jgi:hypothetical protein
MSHDQRPGRMRVVSDAAAARGNAANANAGANAGANAAAGGHAPAGSDGATPAGAGGLPILPALVFLLACGAGGVIGVFLLAGGH